jgi:tRNA A-37 threonylcarbamoyl transferase component Bud32/tetratricopeptide (TPR) repeat protein
MDRDPVMTTPAAAALAERYRLERELGRGGMATVFLAHDLRHGRRVAVKVMHPELANAVGPERFLREIRIAAGLNHPNILPLYDSGTWPRDGGGHGLYYVMPVVEGESLRSRLARESQLPIEDALRIGREVADALDYAHERGVIHRDVKPENILLAGHPPAPGASAGWRVFLTDFGIARALDDVGVERLTETGLALGTPAYMSPEQASADGRTDQRSDVYALGCVLYEMLAGQPPFTGATARAVVARHALDPVPSLQSVRPTVSASLERTVTRALAKVPADRFARAAELGRALTDGDSSAGATPGALPRAQWVLPAAAVAAAIGVAALGLLLRGHHPAATAAADPGVVAVLPFRVAGADPALGYLREGMVDLLAIKLTGEGGPRAADPRAVLSAWRRAGGSPTRDPDPNAALGVARALGAGRLIDGGVVGTAQHVTLTASVVQLPSGRRSARVSVEGPPDSVPALVDRLTAELLAGEAGRTELATLTSLPALRAYFDGQRSYRLGRWADALRAFSKSIRADSTFALSAMGLFSASQWLVAGLWPEGTAPGRAPELAWAHRDRLSPRDRSLLLAQLGPRYPDGSSLAEFIAAREQAVAAAPDRPEAWYELGDEIFHFGALIGIKSPASRAADAFRRSLGLDSASAVFPAFAEPLLHLTQIAAMNGDTASVNRLVASALAADSAMDDAGMLRWIRAAASGDRAALEDVRHRFTQMSRSSLIDITNNSQELGGWEDAQQAIVALRAGPLIQRQQEGASILAHVLALNRGRPKEALLANATMPEHEPQERLHWRVLDALYWDGDTAAGEQAARALARGTGTSSAGSDEDRQAQSHDMCVEQQWRLAHGDSGTSRAAIGRLRGAAPYPLCAAVLETWLTTIGRRPDAARSLDRLDSLLLTGMGDSPTLPPNIIAARLHEALGDPRGALAAIRRHTSGFQPWFLSTYLREEGRLAALTGDTAAAITAYRHYLALRSDPEPSLRTQAAQVRSELAALVAEPR